MTKDARGTKREIFASKKAASFLLFRASSFIRHSACFAALSVTFWSQAAPAPLALHSRSAQFIVSGTPILTAPYISASTAAVSFVRLDPALVAVSSERIKQALLNELGATDQWQDTVTVAIYPVMQDNEPIELTSVHYRNGWKYRMRLPEQVDRSQFIKAIVEVLISEMANRGAGARPAELPPWLVTGLAKHLEATSLSGLTLEPRTALIGKAANPDAIAAVREILRNRNGFTIDQLNWPEPPKSEEQIALYECCAQLLVRDLLRLRGGRACMVDMLARLHQSLNWQTSFLQAYGKHFQRLSDLDKWWAARLAPFEPAKPITPRDEWQLLDNILVTKISRNSTNQVPVNLQTIIAEWEPARQSNLLRQKIAFLRALQDRANGSIGLVIPEYVTVLEHYLRNRDYPHMQAGRKPATGTNRYIAAQSAIQRLNELDARRHALKQAGVEEQSLVIPTLPRNQSATQ